MNDTRLIKLIAKEFSAELTNRDEVELNVIGEQIDYLEMLIGNGTSREG